MAGEFTDKVVVITGATGGVGSIVTKRFVEEGAKVVMWGHNRQSMEKLAHELHDDTQVQLVKVDVTSEESVTAAVNETCEHFDKIDTLLHIAGGFAMPGAVHEGHVDVWNKLIALNATAVYITCGKVAANMLENKVQGSITVVAARGAQKGSKHAAAYSASKAAAIRIVESMSEELKDEGIRVNAISPSTIDTPANRDEMGSENAMKWVSPEEIADTLLFLSSERASAITGANVAMNKRV